VVIYFNLTAKRSRLGCGGTGTDLLRGIIWGGIYIKYIINSTNIFIKLNFIINININNKIECH
jgi:hypothetical protein